MSDTVRSLNTSGLTPKKQIQCWSDTLTDLCGHFDIDPLEASSFEGRINYTTVSKLKLCQIEASQHRLAHTASRAKLDAHPFVKILVPDLRDFAFRTGRPPHRADARRLSRLRCILSAHDRQPDADATRGRHRAEGTAAGTRLPLAKMPACKLSARTGTGRIAYNFVHAAFDEATKLSPNNAIGVADSLIDLLLLPLREPDAMFDRVGPEAMYVRAQFFIREHLRDPDLSIDQISAALSCTKRYLHMLFSDRGTTISDYIRHARLQNCRQELETQAGKSVTDVAFSWGFSSSSHFSRVFREYFGIVPSAIHKAQHGGLSPDFPCE